MKYDLNQIAALEKAISEKYGEIAVKNPKANWDENKEAQYIEQTKKKFFEESKKETSENILGN